MLIRNLVTLDLTFSMTRSRWEQKFISFTSAVGGSYMSFRPADLAVTEPSTNGLNCLSTADTAIPRLTADIPACVSCSFNSCSGSALPFASPNLAVPTVSPTASLLVHPVSRYSAPNRPPVFFCRTLPADPSDIFH